MSNILQTPDHRPIYLQIHDLLVTRLARGEWSPGEPLPSELSLAYEYNASVGTIRKALDIMVTDSLIVRRRGKGTFVRSHSPDSALDHYFRVVCEDGTKIFPEDIILSQAERKPTRRERNALNLKASETVVRIERVRKIQSTAVLTDTITVPAQLFPGFDWQAASRIYQAPYQYYERKFGIRVISVFERLRTAPASRKEARLLGVEQGSCLLEISRHAATFDDVSVELRISHVNTSHHHYLSKIT